MDFFLIDPRLTVVIVLSALVAFLGGVPVASRPAAVITNQVQTATSLSFVFFITARLANLFYLPLLAGFVGKMAAAQRTGELYGLFQVIILASSLGTLAAWVLLPNLVSLYCYLVEECVQCGLMATLLRPASWPELARRLCTRHHLGVRPFRLGDVPPGFLACNVFATAVWTVGALCAVYSSAMVAKEYSSTAVMLSGLVNAFAAITLSLLVDPQAALITDQAAFDPKRPQRVLCPQADVNSAAWHLAFGNFIGSLLGLALFSPGSHLVGRAAVALGQQGTLLTRSLWPLVLLNLMITLLATTAYSSRISALETGARATALSVFNLFSMVMRLTAQLLAPALAAIADTLDRQSQVAHFVPVVRWVLLGASLGALGGLLLMPTFVEIYNQATLQLQRHGSLPAVLLRCILPRGWLRMGRCLRPPGLLGLKAAHLRSLPAGFLWGNLVVVGIHTVGVPASIYAGKLVNDELARSATLLSSLVNGVATITLGLVVDPTASRITDEACNNQRSGQDVRSTVMLLGFTLLLGTLLSQLILLPSATVIAAGAEALF